MQVRISNEGHLALPPSIQAQLGIQPGTWMEVEVCQGVLRASIVAPSPRNQETGEAVPPRGRLASLKPHADAVSGSAEDLDQTKVWDEADWAKEWNP